MKKGKFFGAAVALGISAAALTACGGNVPSTAPIPQITKEQYSTALITLRNDVVETYNTQFGAKIKNADLTFKSQSVNTQDSVRTLNGYYTVNDATENKQYYVNYHLNNYEGGSSQYECLTYLNENFAKLNVELNRTYLLDETWNKLQEYVNENSIYVIKTPISTSTIFGSDYKDGTTLLNGHINSVDLISRDGENIKFSINSGITCTYGNNQKIKYEKVTTIDYNYKNYIFETTDEGIMNTCIDILSNLCRNHSSTVYLTNESITSLQEDIENAPTQAEVDAESDELAQ